MRPITEMALLELFAVSDVPPNVSVTGALPPSDTGAVTYFSLSELPSSYDTVCDSPVGTHLGQSARLLGMLREVLPVSGIVSYVVVPTTIGIEYVPHVLLKVIVRGTPSSVLAAVAGVDMRDFSRFFLPDAVAATTAITMRHSTTTRANTIVDVPMASRIQWLQ
jgi:hypothetical protein